MALTPLVMTMDAQVSEKMCMCLFGFDLGA